MSDGDDCKFTGFPLGPLGLIPREQSIVACSECHIVYQGEKPLGIKTDRYEGKEPISGWIICSVCRAWNELGED